MNCKLGQWARVDGEEEPAEAAENTKGKMTITILGECRRGRYPWHFRVCDYRHRHCSVISSLNNAKDQASRSRRKCVIFDIAIDDSRERAMTDWYLAGISNWIFAWLGME